MARFYEREVEVDGEINTELRVEIVFGVEARAEGLGKPDSCDRLATKADKTRYQEDYDRFLMAKEAAEKAEKALEQDRKKRAAESDKAHAAMKKKAKIRAS